MRGWIGIILAIGFTPALSAQTKRPAPDLIRLSNDRMIVEIDRRTGTIYSVRETKGRFDTNYFGNPVNNPGATYDDPAWTGNVIRTTWELALPERPVVLIPSFSFQPSGKWRQESTGNSGDIRRVGFDGNTVAVSYTGQSKNEGGLKSYDLILTYRLADDRSLFMEWNCCQKHRNMRHHPSFHGADRVPEVPLESTSSSRIGLSADDYSGLPGTAMSRAQQRPCRSSLRNIGFRKSSGCPNDV